MKKISTISRILAGAIALSMLAACGASDDTAETTTTTDTTTAETTTDTADTATDTATESTDIAWPTKSIQMIVPFDAGGDTDYHARQYAMYLEEELGVSIAVSNVVGNSGMLAAKEVYDAANDGYTILFTHSSINVNTAAGTSDIALADFDMVRVCGQPAVEAIAVLADSPYETLDDLVTAIQAAPGDYIVPASLGATSHYAALLMEKVCDVDLNIVSSGASSDRTAGLVGGNFEFIINPYGTMKSFIDAGDFRILGTYGSERSEQFSDIPTATEEGYPELVSENVYYIVLPAGTDEAINEKLGAAIDNISMNNQEYADAIASAHYQDTFLLNREESIAYAEAELERFMSMSAELQS